MNETKIILHLGVHKTATTHIQSRLYNSMDILNSNNIGYVSLGDTRNFITAKLNQDKFPQKEILNLIQPYLQYGKLVLSDENFLGGTDKPFDNKIYVNAVPRLTKLLSIFEGYNIEVHISLRNYVDYFISRYAEFLRHYPFVLFEKYYENIDFNTVSWLKLIEQIKMSGITNLHIVQYEDIFTNEQAYFDTLLGIEGIKLESANENPATKRSKFSKQGYEVVKFYAETFSRKSAKKILNLLDNNIQETEQSIFMPFEKELQEKLFFRYQEEMNILKKEQ